MRVDTWARLSIAAKLPLSLAALLSVGFGAMTAAVCTMMRDTVLNVASERLDRAAHQMSDTLGTSARQRITLIQNLAARVQTVIQTKPEEPSGAPIGPVLESYVGANAQAMSIEWWSADARRVAFAGAAMAELTPPQAGAITDSVSTANGAVVLPYRRDSSSLTYAIGLAVRDGASTLGYLVERRRVVASSGPTMALLMGLVGSDARLLIGNAGGDVWADLKDPDVALQVPAEAQRAMTSYTDAAGTVLLVRAVPIADTTWQVGVAFPRAPVLAPVQRFLWMAVALSALLVSGGALVGWMLSRRITTPLRLVTDAAEALATAGSATRIPVTRQDEVGRLASSFNAMADQVELSRSRLEALVVDLERRVRERTADLEISNRELEAFSYSVSHDLRAPLRAIDGFARMCMEEHGEAMPPEAVRHLTVIVQRTHYMAQLIDGLLTFARLARQSLNQTPLHMEAIAREVVASVRPMAQSPVCDVLIGALPPARGERILIQQVLANLVSNAIKFSRNHAAPRVEIGCREHGGQQVYFVRDNGVGFDMQYSDKLFGVFQRLHRAEEFEGTGVGLALVRRIVERHGGRVWAESRPGHGATFYFTLQPVAETASTPASDSRATGSALRRERALVGP